MEAFIAVAICAKKNFWVIWQIKGIPRKRNPVISISKKIFGVIVEVVALRHFAGETIRQLLAL
jgi:hypothetical protein